MEVKREYEFSEAQKALYYIDDKIKANFQYIVMPL